MSEELKKEALEKEEKLKSLKRSVRAYYPEVTEESFSKVTMEDLEKLLNHAIQTGMPIKEYGSGLEAAVYGGLQEATFGNYPEIKARIEAPFSEKDYEELKKIYEQDIKRNIEEHPLSALTGGALGMFGSSKVLSPVVKALKPVTKFSSEALNKLATTMKESAALGAASGALYNTGLDEYFFESPEALITKGAQIAGGGALGAGIGGGVKLTGGMVDKLGKLMFSIPFRKIDNELYLKNKELGKTQFSDLLWKYQTSGNYQDIQKAVEKITSEENYPVIKEVKKQMDEGTLGIEGTDLIKLLYKSLNPKPGEFTSEEPVKKFISNEVQEAISRKPPMGPILDYKKPGTVQYTPYPEQMSMVPKDEITGFEIFPKEGEPAVSEAFWRVMSGSKKPPTPFIGPRQNIVTPKYEATLVPEPPGVPFQTEMENIVLGFKDVPNTKMSFSELYDFTKKLQKLSSWASRESGEIPSTQKDLYRRAATKARKIREQMIDEMREKGVISPELQNQWKQSMQEIGTVSAAREPLNKLVGKELSGEVIPYRDAIIGAGLGNIIGNLAFNSPAYGQERNWNYWDNLTTLGLISGLLTKPRSAQFIGRTGKKIGQGTSELAPQISRQITEEQFSSIPAYLKRDVEE